MIRPTRPPRARRAAAALVLALAAVPPAARAQAAPPLTLERLSGPVRVDGVLDEPAWAGLAPLPLTLYTPVFRGEPTQRSEIRVAYDDHALYVAGWFYDSEPNAIRVNSLYRDRWNGDDALAVYVDAFNDNQTARWFGTTPAGMRFDVLVTDDGATLNDSWDTFWQAEARVTPAGWFAEVRIPFSSLGFHAVDDEVVMGLTVTRLVSRLNERVTFPAIDPRYEFRKPSVAQDVVLSGVRGARPLYVAPYALTGVDQRPYLPADAAAFTTERDFSREAGLDVRYPVTPELTLDVTVNTDFAQVEADDQQVNLDRFGLFYPEKRRFFQEGSGVFDFSGGGGSRLFHSRTIGLTAAGARVPVLGGARLVGRAGAWDVGALAMRTDEVPGLPAESFGVLRLRRPVLNAFSTAGLMLTSRMGGVDNHAVGGDAVLRVTGDHYLTLRGSGTFTAGDSLGLWERSQLLAQWQRRTGRGLQYDLTLGRAGGDYRPDLGFLQRRGYTTANVVGNWFFFTDAHPVLRRVYPGALAFSTFRNEGGALWSGQYALWVQWDTKAGGGGWIEPKLFVEDVETPFTIGGEVEIPAGRHEYADLQLVLIMPSGARLRTFVDMRAGSYFDGTRAQIILRPTWNVSRHLELGGEYQLSRLRFDTRGQGVDVHVGRLRIGTALDARASGNAFLQYNSTTDRVNVNLRLRYNFAEGTDLWLVYDEGLAMDRDLDDPAAPELPLSAGRSLILKYTHTFRL